MGSKLQVSSDRLEKLRFEASYTGLQGKSFIHNTNVAYDNL